MPKPQKLSTFADANPQGEMAEWSIAAVLKTVEGHASGGSNPSLSAINAENQQIAKQAPNFTPKNVKLGVFVLFRGCLIMLVNDREGLTIPLLTTLTKI